MLGLLLKCKVCLARGKLAERRGMGLRRQIDAPHPLAGSDNRDPHAGGAPQSSFGSIGEVTGLPAFAQRRVEPRGQPPRAVGGTGGSGLPARGGAGACPAPLLGDAGMFTLLTAAAGGGGAGVAGGWAAARLALGTRLAVRRVAARACSERPRGRRGGRWRSAPGLAATAPGPAGLSAAPPGRAARAPRVPRGQEIGKLPTSW